MSTEAPVAHAGNAALLHRGNAPHGTVTRPRVSIVINTLNRADSLRRTLLTLQRLAYPDLETVVVAGPSEDGTAAVLSEFAPRIKVVRCDAANLSVSRNVGIREASGDLVAFIDDDSVPDPWWLDDIVPAFEDREVAGASGPVYDYDGRMSATHSVVDLHGDEQRLTDGSNPSRLLAAPCSALIVYAIGTNAVFRRTALVDVGGFDEEFAHYFDDADIARRLTNRGWRIEACEGGFVQHLRDPSALRTADRGFRSLYPIVRSRLYFALRHARTRDGSLEVMRRFEGAVGRYRNLVPAEYLADCSKDAVRAVDDAFESASLGPHTREEAWFDREAGSFLPFDRSLPKRRLHVCIISHEYPPKQLTGVRRHNHQVAVSLATRGHIVRVLTEGQTHEGVSLEEGVWVHRVVPARAARPRHIDTPKWVWNFSTRVLEELRRIDHAHRVDIVHMSSWNAEGIAIVEDGTFTTVVAHGGLDTIRPLERSLGDFSADGDLRIQVLFVGRLEARQGIDTLLSAIALLLPNVRDVDFTLVGDNTIKGEHGVTYQEEFETSIDQALWGSRVFFPGVVPDDELARYYAGCDIVVGPLDQQSFGLIPLEALGEAKPVIAGDVAGMREIVEHEGNGLLVSPSDATGLADSIKRLVESPVDRERFGRRSRQLFVEKFTAERMAEGYEEYYLALAAR